MNTVVWARSRQAGSLYSVKGKDTVEAKMSSARAGGGEDNADSLKGFVR